MKSIRACRQRRSTPASPPPASGHRSPGQRVPHRRLHGADIDQPVRGAGGERDKGAARDNVPTWPAEIERWACPRQFRTQPQATIRTGAQQCRPQTPACDKRASLPRTGSIGDHQQREEHCRDQRQDRSPAEQRDIGAQDDDDPNQCHDRHCPTRHHAPSLAEQHPGERSASAPVRESRSPSLLASGMM